MSSTYLLRSVTAILKSPGIYAGLMFMAGFMGAIGASGHGPPVFLWLPITYFMYSMAMSGGLSRAIMIGGAAFSYLIRHVGLKARSLVFQIVLSASISIYATTPAFMLLFIGVYKAFGQEVVISNPWMLLLAILLIPMFTTSLGSLLGLTLIKANAVRIVNAVPMLPLIIFMIAIAFPAADELGMMLNPFSASLNLMIDSLIGVSRVTMAIASLTSILAYTAIFMALSAFLMRDIREVNVYDALKL